jgi:hypothetical protein
MGESLLSTTGKGDTDSGDEERLNLEGGSTRGDGNL